MLSELSIRDVALIPEMRLGFGPGLNVFSGETGAGKSLIVGGLRLLCGERAPADLVRRGADRAVVEGIFEIDPNGWIARSLADLGIEAEDGEVIVRREVVPGGKGRVRVNGAAVPLTTLRAAAESLVDLHGQHDHQSLLRPAFQLDVLDDFAALWPARREFGNAFEEWRRAAAELEQAEAASVEDRERRELARFQWSELEGASVAPGERAQLLVERGRLERAEFLRTTAARLVERIAEGDDSIHDTVADAAREAETAAEHDPGWETVGEGLESVAITLAELASEVRRLGEAAVDDPARLEVVRDRLRLLDDLLKKYGPREDDLFAFWERLAAEVEDPKARERRVTALRERVSELSDRLAGLGLDLSKKRRKVAKKLGRAVAAALGDLGMMGTRFEVDVTARAQGLAFSSGEPDRLAGSSGLDAVEFALSANRGEELRPLRSVASGGEISRVMLGLKSVLGEARTTATMVFDEIDTGVGGRVAAKVASVLEGLAERRQVICITHLAAIASRAAVHLRVVKDERDGRTISRVETVEGESRVQEIARMLGGEADEGIAVEHARELLKGVAS